MFSYLAAASPACLPSFQFFGEAVLVSGLAAEPCATCSSTSPRRPRRLPGPPRLLTVLVPTNRVKCVFARSLRGDECHHRRHLNRHIDKRVALHLSRISRAGFPIVRLVRAQVSPEPDDNFQGSNIKDCLGLGQQSHGLKNCGATPSWRAHCVRASGLALPFVRASDFLLHKKPFPC
jgi:hypothetical protein